MCNSWKVCIGLSGKTGKVSFVFSIENMLLGELATVNRPWVFMCVGIMPCNGLG